MTDIQRNTRDVEEALQSIASWAKRGTQHQFYNEMQAKLAEAEECRVDIRDETVIFSRVGTEGGFLGIGAKTVEEPVLEVRKDEDLVVIPEKPRDPDFVLMLADLLERH